MYVIFFSRLTFITRTASSGSPAQTYGTIWMNRYLEAGQGRRSKYKWHVSPSENIYDSHPICLRWDVHCISRIFHFSLFLRFFIPAGLFNLHQVWWKGCCADTWNVFLSAKQPRIKKNAFLNFPNLKIKLFYFDSWRCRRFLICLYTWQICIEMIKLHTPLMPRTLTVLVKMSW